MKVDIFIEIELIYGTEFNARVIYINICTYSLIIQIFLVHQTYIKIILYYPKSNIILL